MDISSLENIAAITKVVNPKENLETASKSVSEKEMDTSTDKTTASVKPQSPMELKLETQEAINKLLKSINKLLGDSVEKLPPQLKEQLTNIIKQNTTATNLNDGLANLLRAQKNINQDILKLSDSVIKNLFEQLETNTGVGLQKNNTLSTSLLKPESMFGDALPKENILPEKLVEKVLNEILAKTADTGKEATAPPKTTGGETINDKTNPPAENTAAKAPTNSDNVATKTPNETVTTKAPDQSPANMKQAEQGNNLTKDLPQNISSNQQQSTNNTKLPEQNIANKTSLPNSEQSITPKTTAQENIMPTKAEANISPEKPANTLPQNDNNSKPAQTTTAMEAKPNINILKSDVPVSAKAETPMTAANRLIETLRVSENQLMPKTNQDVQTLLIGLKDNLMKLTENNSQLNNLLQKFLNEGKDLNKSETVLLSKFISDNLPKLLSDNKIIEQQILPKEAVQILQKNSLNNNEQTQKDLELLNNANKNTNTSEAAKQIKTQVESWSNTIKDLANTFIKSNQNSPDTNKSLQTSFAFMMNGEDGKPKPAHIHIYHEKKRRDNSVDKPAETWLKLSLDYEYAGEVSAVFHLKNESILDIKVSFSEIDAVEPFKTFIPDIKNALADSKLSLTQIVAE